MGRTPVKKLPFVASVLTVCAIAVLCALGVWQVKRLHWKEDIIAQMVQARSAGPRDASYSEIDGDGPLYVRMQGRYEQDIVFSLAPRTHEGRSGSHVLSPFTLRGGGHVIVNRGWVPEGEGSKAMPPQGETVVTGLLRRPERPNIFVPGNNPDNNIWFSVDLPQMAAIAGITDFAPFVLYAESEAPESASPQPVRAALQWSPRNDHLQYALFWFSMAVALAVIFCLRFLRE